MHRSLVGREWAALSAEEVDAELVLRMKQQHSQDLAPHTRCIPGKLKSLARKKTTS